MTYTAYKKVSPKLETSDADSLAKPLIEAAMAGTLDLAIAKEICETEDLGTWTEILKKILEEYKDFADLGGNEYAGENITNWVKAMSNGNDSLRILLAATEESEGVVEEIDNIPMPLPGVLPDESLGISVRQWLDAFSKWVLQWHPFVHPMYAEATGVFVLSVLAARRIVVEDMGEPIYTSLYVMLFAESSVGKSTCAKMARRLIVALGVGSALLAEGKITPQKFIQDSTGNIPRNVDFEDMTESAEEAMMIKLRYAGKRAQIVDEFGQQLANMYSPNGTYKQNLSMMLGWYGSDMPDGYDSIANNSNIVENPYMPFMGCGTFKNVRDILAKDPYGDGFIPRWAALGLPKQPYIPRKRVSGKISIPHEVLSPARDFINRLGEPVVHIQEEKTKKGTSTYRSVVDYYPEHAIYVTSEAREYIDKYEDFLQCSAGTGLVHEDMEPCYRRMGDRAIRVAALIAFMGNGGEIDTRVWAAAVHISERWRKHSHVFHEEVTKSVFAPDKSTEDKIVKFLEKQADNDPPLWQPISIIANRVRVDIAKVQRILDSLVSAGVLATPMDSTKKAGVVLYAMEGTPVPIAKKQGRPKKVEVEVIAE